MLREAGHVLHRRLLLTVCLLAACGDDDDGDDDAPTTDAGTDADALPSGCPANLLAPGDHDVVVDHGGRAHTFRVHVPAGAGQTAPAPVVLFFHGGGGTADGQELIVKLLPSSDAHGFVLVRGEGFETPGGNGEVWNAGACCAVAADTALAIDHVGAVDAFLDQLELELCVDTRRVYATGHSNGGMFAYRLACERADRIAAIAPNAAMLMNRDLDAEPVVTLFDCQPSRPVPVLHTHGLADLCAPFDGGSSNGLDPATRPPVPYGIDVFRTANGCAGTPAMTYANGGATCLTWSGCADDADVTLCTIDGAGHTWPGSTLYRPATKAMCGGDATLDLDVNEMMWQFFVDHPML